MDHIQQIDFSPATWCDQVAGYLKIIADVNEREINLFKIGSNNGTFQILNVVYNGEIVGCAVWSIEKELDGETVIVINAFAAKSFPDVCLITDLFLKMQKLCQTLGASSLRCWTGRAGLVRKLETIGAKKKYVLEFKQ